MKRKRIAMAGFLAVAFLWTAAFSCQPAERTSYETVVAAKAFLDKAKSLHPECTTGTTSTVCVDLAKATAAKDAMIDVMETLCAGPNFNNGLACDFPKKGAPGYQQAIDKLNAAILNYNQTATDLKGVL